MTRQAPDPSAQRDLARSGDFDEQLWPIQLIILIVAGAAAGLVAATSDFPDPAALDFTDPAVVETGWGRLATVALAYLAGTASVLLLQRWIARRVLFCLLLGMIIHLGLGLTLRDQYLEAVVRRGDEEQRLAGEPAEAIVLPDYHISQIVPSDVPLSFALPVAADPPAESQPTAVEKAREEHEVVADPLEPASPQTPERPPSPIQLEKAELAVPHRGESPAGIEVSRQPARVALDPNDPQPLPESLPTPAAPAANLAAGEAAARRRIEPSRLGEQVNRWAGDEPAAPLPTPAAVPQDHRREMLDPAEKVAGMADPQVARSRRVETLDAPAPPQVEAIASAAAIGRPAIDAVRASSSVGRAATNLGALAPQAEAATQSPGDMPQLDAGSLGRPRTSSERRPSLEIEAAGNPLSRAPRAVRVAGADPAAIAALPQVAATGAGSPAQPDSEIEASVPGPTRRVSGGTTELAAGRTSPSPATGSLWESGMAAVPPRRAVALEQASPSDSGGGGRDPLARAPIAAGLAGPIAPPIGPADATAAGGGGAAAEPPGQGQAAPSSGAIAERNAGATGLETRPTGAARNGDVTGLEARAAGGEGDGGAAGLETRAAGVERRQVGPAVLAGPVAGPGGLGEPPSPLLGIPSRRARPESVVVHTDPGRFMLDRAGAVKPPALPFQQRFPDKRAGVARMYGATESSDRAVEQGLYFLSRCQFPDGRWALDRLPPGVVPPTTNAGLGQMNCDTAATGLALLAFLGNGYTHIDDKYRNQVGAGLRWLTANQQADGRLYSEETDQTLYAQSYGNGIATIALSEAYGMTWDEELREPLEKAIGFILASQHPERGGWRYLPRLESDTSVSGWQLMALKSAQMAGLEVPGASLEKVSGWLDLAQGRTGAEYRYNPYALDTEAQRLGRVPNAAMTAEGLLMRVYLGRQRNHPEMIAGADYLLENLPPRPDDTRAFRDVYYLYYATQVMFQMQGDYWKAWNDRLRPLLEATQVQSGPLIGSWNPDTPVADRWGYAGGRHYVTAISLLMLEVYYRHLPLFRELDAQPAAETAPLAPLKAGRQAGG